MRLESIAVIGAGRVGLTLARALIRSGPAVRVLGRHARLLPEPLAPVETDWMGAVVASGLVIIAVPDDTIAEIALVLAGTKALTDRHVVLHTSGLHDRSALEALGTSGAALGSWHPLQTFALPDGDPGALPGTPVAIEGDIRALEAGRALAALLHLRPIVEIPPGGKARYHAAAVIASNYLVVLADVAARLARDAGAGDASTDLFLPLIRRTLLNYAAGGPATLTGPVSRGDAGTVARHLEALTGTDRALYVALGREALKLARAAGLGEQKAAALEVLFY